MALLLTHSGNHKGGTPIMDKNNEPRTMSALGSPCIRFRRIGMELRGLRTEAGMTLKQAGELLSRSRSSISLIETGSQAIRFRDLDYFLLKYGHGEGPYREAMLELAQDASKSGWWRTHEELSPELMDFISLEAGARHISVYQTLIIPELLQTPDYAREVHRTQDSEFIERTLRIQAARQKLLQSQNAPKLNVIITEAALRSQTGGTVVMKGQLKKLIEASQLEHVTLQVIPYSSGTHRGLQSPFTMLETGTRLKLVVVMTESPQGITCQEHPERSNPFAETFEELRKTALSETDSRAFMNRLAAA